MSEEQRKTKTSTDVKRKYNNKMYAQIKFELPKDIVAEFKECCKSNGVSQASVIKAAMQKYIDENNL